MSKIKYNSPKDHPDFDGFIKAFEQKGCSNDFKYALEQNDKELFAKLLFKWFSEFDNKDFLLMMKHLRKFKSFLSICEIGFNTTKKYKNVIITKSGMTIENKNIVIITNSEYSWIRNVKYILVQHNSLAIISNNIKSEVHVKGNSDVSINGEKVEIFVKDTSEARVFGDNIVKAYNRSVIIAGGITKCFMSNYSSLYTKDKVECMLLHESKGILREESSAIAKDFSKVNVDGKCKIKGEDESKISLFNCETLHVNKKALVVVRECSNRKDCKNEIIAEGRSVINIFRSEKNFDKTIIAKENATVISEFESDKIKTKDNASIKLVK